MAFAAISSGTSGLLIISFETFGYIVMDNEPYVGLVDAHSEGYCGDNHIHFFQQESVLVVGACCRIHPGMVG